MIYKIKPFNVNLGFNVNEGCILKATEELNKFLTTLSPSLYRNIDFKTTGALIGAVYCTKLSAEIKDSMVNPIEKGYPDIIPTSGLNASEEELRNYPYGLELEILKKALNYTLENPESKHLAESRGKPTIETERCCWDSFGIL